MKPKLTIISLGAGVQSSALLIAALNNELPDDYDKIDAAIFADTKDEPDEVYTWLQTLEEYSDSRIPIYKVTHKSGKSLSEHSLKVRGKDYLEIGVPVFVPNAMVQRQCTYQFKIVPIKRKIRELMREKGRKVCDQLLGISLDEVSRMKDSRVQYLTNRYPLIDMRWTRTTAFNYVKKHLGTPPRSACVFCPYHTNREWSLMKSEQPNEFAKAVAYEKRLREAARKTNSFEGETYLHKSLQPLDTIAFTPEDAGQITLFDYSEECEGMCGI